MKSYTQDWELFIIVKPRKNQLSHYQWCILLLKYGLIIRKQRGVEFTTNFYKNSWGGQCNGKFKSWWNLTEAHNAWCALKGRNITYVSFQSHLQILFWIPGKTSPSPSICLQYQGLVMLHLLSSWTSEVLFHPAPILHLTHSSLQLWISGKPLLWERVTHLWGLQLVKLFLQNVILTGK